jgi:hypothetical protein
MRNRELSKVANVVGRILLAFLFAFSQSAWAGEDPKAKDNPKQAQQAAVQQTGEKRASATTLAKMEAEEQAEAAGKSSAEEKPSGDGKHEGIKVHGHWTIEVKNPDGTRASRVEFENSLCCAGATALSGLLLGDVVPGGFSVYLSNGVGVGNQGPCSPNAGGSTFCVFVGSLTNPTPNTFGDTTTGCPLGANCFPLSIALGGFKMTDISLTGTATAGSNGQITDVDANNLLCGPTSLTATTPANAVSPNTCAAGPVTNGYGLTHATLSSPVQVQAGQSILVNVVISFS